MISFYLHLGGRLLNLQPEGTTNTIVSRCEIRRKAHLRNILRE